MRERRGCLRPAPRAPVGAPGRVHRRASRDAGFTLVEFLIASAIITAVLGSTVLLATQMQRVYGTQLDDTTVEEELRFALDWIARDLRSTGNNPYGIAGLTALQITGDNQIRIQADVNPPDGDITDGDEDVTITIAGTTITRTNHNVAAAAVVMSEPVIADLEFIYLDSDRVVTADPDEVAYVRVRVTGRSQAFSSLVGGFTETTLETEVRLRTL